MTANWFADYNFNRQQNEAAQAAVNEAAHGSTPEMLLAHVVAVADSFHLPYCQYANYWDGAEWRLMQAKRQIKTKAGVAFEPGDWTVVKVESWVSCMYDLTAYSIRNRSNTVVFSGDFQERGPVSVFTCPNCDSLYDEPLGFELYPSHKLEANDFICDICGHPRLETLGEFTAAPVDLRTLYYRLGDGVKLDYFDKQAIFRSQHSALAFRTVTPDTWTVMYQRRVETTVDTAV